MAGPSAHRAVSVLLVEDDPRDVELTREALEESSIHADLHVVGNGEEALAYLDAASKRSRPRPDLILLDLNMPRMDGRETLRALKAHPDFRTIPVVVLTTSHVEEDVLAVYDLQASCYVVKPLDFHDYVRVVEAIDRFWFGTVTFASG